MTIQLVRLNYEYDYIISILATIPLDPFNYASDDFSYYFFRFYYE